MQVTYKLGANGLKQFFVFSYYADGAVGQSEPFATGEAACAEIARLEADDAAAEEAEAAAWDEDMEQLAWAEAGGYAAGIARPCGRRASFIDVDMHEDIPF